MLDEVNRYGEVLVVGFPLAQFSYHRNENDKNTIMKLVPILAIGLSLLFVAHSVRAADSNSSGYVKAELIEESTKWDVSYPGQAITTNRSGAVELVYMVDISGKPTEIVVSSYTNEMFIKNAIKAVKKYRFTPASLNGEPVPSFGRKVFRFSGRLLNSKTFKQFNKYYQLFSEELSKPESDPVLLQKHLDRMAGMRQANPTMQAILNNAKMVYAKDYLTLDEKIEVSTVAHIYRLGRLGKSRALAVRRQLISQLVEAGRYADAAEKIKPWRSYSSPSKVNGNRGKFAQTLDEIAELERSEKSFSNAFTVNERGYALRNLLKKRFTIDQVDGQVDELVFRCETKFYRMKFNLDQDYQVPNGWGYCNLQISGKAGTKGRLIEG